MIMDTPVRKSKPHPTKLDFQNKTRIKLKFHNGEKSLDNVVPDPPPWHPKSPLPPTRGKPEASNSEHKEISKSAKNKTPPVSKRDQ